MQPPGLVGINQLYVIGLIDWSFKSVYKVFLGVRWNTRKGVKNLRGKRFYPDKGNVQW